MARTSVFSSAFLKNSLCKISKRASGWIQLGARAVLGAARRRRSLYPPPPTPEPPADTCSTLGPAAPCDARRHVAARRRRTRHLERNQPIHDFLAPFLGSSVGSTFLNSHPGNLDSIPVRAHFKSSLTFGFNPVPLGSLATPII